MARLRTDILSEINELMLPYGGTINYFFHIHSRANRAMWRHYYLFIHSGAGGNRVMTWHNHGNM